MENSQRKSPLVEDRSSISFVQTMSARVPDIVIEDVCSSEPNPAPSNSVDMPTVIPMVKFGKKMRAHSDSTIYEMKNARTYEDGDVKAWNRSDSGTFEKTNFCLDEKSLKNRRIGEAELGIPFVWQLDSAKKLGVGLKNSPKNQWLRRISDSNISGKNTKGSADELVRSRSTGDTAVSPPVPDVSVKKELPEKMEDGPECSNTLIEKFSDARADLPKWSKPKKYLQTRYQNFLNQSVEADDVFDKPSSEISLSWVDKRLPDLLELPRRESGRFPAAHLDLEGNPTSEYDPDFKPDQDVFSPNLIASPEVLLNDDKYFDYARSGMKENSRSFSKMSSSPVSAEPINQTRSVFTFPVSSQQYLSLRCTQSGSDSFLYGIVPRTPSSGSLLLSPMLSSPLTFDRFHFDDVASPIFFGFGNYSSCDLGKPGSQSNGDGMSVAQDLTMDSVRKLSDNTVKENNASQQELSKHFPMSKLVTSIDEGQGQTAHRSKLTLDDASFPKCSPKRKSPLSGTSSLVSSPTLPPKTAAFSSQTSIPCHLSEFSQNFETKVTLPSDLAAPFHCPICSNSLPTYNSLAKHMVSHLPSEVISKENGVAGETSKLHLCKICDRVFSRSDMLSRHMRLHTGLRPYECHQCGQVFSRSDHLHTHLRTHTGEKPYHCSQCLYAAPRRDMVTRHMRVHLRGKPRKGRRSSSADCSASRQGQPAADSSSPGAKSGGKSNNGQQVQAKLQHPTVAALSLKKARNWSLTSNESIEGPDLPDPGQSAMIRTGSVASIDSGVSYLTPRSLVPSLWSPGVIDSPDVFTRQPPTSSHFLWPTTSASSQASHFTLQNAIDMQRRILVESRDTPEPRVPQKGAQRWSTSEDVCEDLSSRRRTKLDDPDQPQNKTHRIKHEDGAATPNKRTPEASASTRHCTGNEKFGADQLSIEMQASFRKCQVSLCSAERE